MQHSTLNFAEELIQSLKPEYIQKLINKTIANGRSIGTLHLALRELSLKDKALLAKLEQAIGAENFLNLITGNGTIFELFMIIKYSTLDFAKELIQSLSPEYIQQLINKTIANGRSIGTLSFSLRELGLRDKALLAKLEQAIGADNQITLIKENGTIIELFQCLEYSTSDFREEILGGLDNSIVQLLINNAIAESRSIESLYAGMDVLAKNPKQQENIQRLVGISGWWKLICQNGTLNSLIQLSGKMTESFRTSFIEESNQLSLTDWKIF